MANLICAINGETLFTLARHKDESNRRIEINVRGWGKFFKRVYMNTIYIERQTIGAAQTL